MRYEFNRSSVIGSGDADAILAACQDGWMSVLTTEFFGLELEYAVLGGPGLEAFRQNLGASQDSLHSSAFDEMVDELDGCASVLVVASPTFVVLYGSPWEHDMMRASAELATIGKNAGYFRSGVDRFSSLACTPATAEARA